MSAGRRAGANKPNQVSMLKSPRPRSRALSAIVGTSGITLERRSVVIAIARSLPARMLADAVARLSKVRSTWPDSNASCAGGPPAYGMCTMNTPALALNISPAR